ncbi:MAG: glycosyltransferase family 2 protein [Chloroflexaceae bacterium]|nr:glycosyltransferase family 2 protein [Chloroflexaceae bacterium]
MLVDDGSTDETPICLAELAQGSLYRVLRHETNLGIAAARNTGVRQSQGQGISFCDADDCFLETHLFQVLGVLNRPVTHPDPNLQRCGDYPAAVKTRVRIQDILHPEWQRRVEWSIPLNLCLRREVHAFLGGFPEENAFRECSYGTEDSAYSQWLHQFFQVVTLPIATVEHFRYPGNHLDKQLARFQHPPGAYRESVCDRDRQLLADIDGIIEVRSQRLRDKSQFPSQT